MWEVEVERVNQFIGENTQSNVLPKFIINEAGVVFCDDSCKSKIYT